MAWFLLTVPPMPTELLYMPEVLPDKPVLHPMTQTARTLLVRADIFRTALVRLVSFTRRWHRVGAVLGRRSWL